jgi:quercetin dioxygenase-like cupin family protein
MDYRNVARVEVADGDLILTSTRGQVLCIPAGEWHAYGEVDADGDAFAITHYADGSRPR